MNSADLSQSISPILIDWIHPILHWHLLPKLMKLNLNHFLLKNNVNKNVYFFDDFYSMQKFESTRNRMGIKYSPSSNELSVREVFLSKFHTSVVALKICDWERFQKWIVTNNTTPQLQNRGKSHWAKSSALHFWSMDCRFWPDDVLSSVITRS